MSIACSSTPTIGAGFFSPSAKFAAPRAYWAAIKLGWVANSFDQNENVLIGGGSFIPPTRWVLHVNPKFWDWNSNGYTLDHIVCESYYERLLTFERLAAPYSVQFFLDPDTDLPGLLIANADAIPLYFNRYDLPDPTSPYWLPDV